MKKRTNLSWVRVGWDKKSKCYESLQLTEGCAVTHRDANSLDHGDPLDFNLILPSWFFTIVSAAREKHHAMCHVKVLLEQNFPHQISPCIIGLYVVRCCRLNLTVQRGRACQWTDLWLKDFVLASSYVKTYTNLHSISIECWGGGSGWPFDPLPSRTQMQS